VGEQETIKKQSRNKVRKKSVNFKK